MADRLNDMGCEVLITQDEGWRSGNNVPLKANADEALEPSPGVKSRVVLAADGRRRPMQDGRDRVGRARRGRPEPGVVSL